MSNIAQDELDAMLQGNSQDDPSVSQAGTEDSGSHAANPIEGAGGQAEEVEFSKLSGDAQDRFRRLYRERQDALAENQRLKSMIAGGQVQQPQVVGQMTPEVKQALSKLDEAGVATKDFVQQQIQDILSRKSFYDELDKLEQELNGSDDKPKFVREEYNDYIDRHPQYKGYLPKDVYNIMYRSELMDWEMNHRGQAPVKKNTTLKPTRTSAQQSELTMEEIENKLSSLKEPQRTEWYTANLKRINEVVSRGQ